MLRCLFSPTNYGCQESGRTLKHREAKDLPKVTQIGSPPQLELKPGSPGTSKPPGLWPHGRKPEERWLAQEIGSRINTSQSAKKFVTVSGSASLPAVSPEPCYLVNREERRQRLL